MPATDTKELILNAAEELFAKHGFDATSLRTITSSAGVNLAAIHYHYGSKEALIEAVICRRLDVINQERLELLETCVDVAEEEPVSLECLLRAFVAPALRLSSDRARGGALFIRLMGHAYNEPSNLLFKIFMTRYADLLQRFIRAIHSALPALPPEEIMWRFHFMIGTMAHTMGGIHKMGVPGAHPCPQADTEEIIERLVTFAAAGMRGSMPSGKGGD